MVLASEVIVNAALIDHLYGSALPSFGGERRGSPVACSVRIADRRIREKTQVYTPNCIVLADTTLLGFVNVFSGVKEGSIFLLNSTNEPGDLSFPPQINKVGIVDATTIAIEVLGTPVVNTAIVGAFAKTTEWILVDSVIEGIRRVMPGKLLQKNIEAARRAADEVRIFDLRAA